MYEDFAEVYDELMDDYDYDQWAAFYAKRLLSFGQLRGNVVECACGTGNLTARLAKMGFSMIGIDNSTRMLAAAEKKMRTFGVMVPLVHSDMCTFETARKPAAVLCTCDGINYLTDPEKVQRFFAHVRAKLKDSGIFCFDVSTFERIEHKIGNQFFGEERDGLAYIWKNDLNERLHTVHMDMTFFVRESDGRYRRFREEQRMRAYSIEELSTWLQNAGFTDIQVFGGMREDAPLREDDRVHILARASSVN